MPRRFERCLALVLGLAMMVMTLPAFAHHGWSDYDASKRAVLTGTIRELHFGNPHCTILIETPDRTWRVMLDSPARLNNRGVTKEMLGVGRSLTLEGLPHKGEDNAFRAERLMIDGKTIELR